MKKIFVILVLSVSLLISSSFEGIGYASSVKEAKYEALSDLSSSIKSEVNSAFVSHKYSDNKTAISKSESRIEVSSNLPLIGIEYDVSQMSSTEYKARVSLSVEKSEALYLRKLQNLSEEISGLDSQSLSVKNSAEKEALLSLLLEKLNEYDRYESVATVLGLKSKRGFVVNTSKVQSRLLKIYNKIDSIDLAAKVISQKFKKFENIYIYAPKQDKNREVTPFAKSVKMQLSSNLHVENNLVKASYLLLGKYTKSSNSIILSYTLVNAKDKTTINNSTVVLQEKAYANLRTEVQNVNFETLLYDGVVMSSDFKVSVSTNQGTDELLFLEKDEVNILVKLNKMGYFYIVGYTQLKDSKQSYILELEEAPGNNKFIKFVNADDANRWIDIGTFEVEPPYGLESLQVIASDKKITNVPDNHYDEDSGYYILGNNLSKSLSKTRGLMKKKSKNKKAKKSEAVLMFTTMRR